MTPEWEAKLRSNLTTSYPAGSVILEVLTELDEVRIQLAEASAREAVLRAALVRAKQGYENLLDLKILPHAGWDDATREYIAEYDAALKGTQP